MMWGGMMSRKQHVPYSQSDELTAVLREHGLLADHEVQEFKQFVSAL